VEEMDRSESKKIIKDFLTTIKLLKKIVKLQDEQITFLKEEQIPFLKESHKKSNNMKEEHTLKMYNLYERKIAATEKKLLDMEDNGRTFSITLMRKIKQIEKSIPKPTQSACVILANRELKVFPESDLIDEYGKPTQLLLSIRDSYKAQKKKL
jgi:hypothetical protein